MAAAVIPRTFPSSAIPNQYAKVQLLLSTVRLECLHYVARQQHASKTSMACIAIYDGRQQTAMVLARPRTWDLATADHAAKLGVLLHRKDAHQRQPGLHNQKQAATFMLGQCSRALFAG